jgi:hypothetical protein
MMRELLRGEYNEPSCSSRAAYKMYIWWTKLTAVKYGNKSGKHITRTVSPPGVPTRLTLRIRIVSNNLLIGDDSDIVEGIIRTLGDPSRDGSWAHTSVRAASFVHGGRAFVRAF